MTNDCTGQKHKKKDYIHRTDEVVLSCVGLDVLLVVSLVAVILDTVEVEVVLTFSTTDIVDICQCFLSCYFL